MTVDVDLIMRDEDLQGFKSRHLGHGYAERVVGTGKLLDTEFNVHIDVRSTGRFPGDDKPKPIAFPDPATTAIRGAPFAMLPIERWIELKLASGIVAPAPGQGSRRRSGADQERWPDTHHEHAARPMGPLSQQAPFQGKDLTLLLVDGLSEPDR